jgi:addiction module HigA family antidote
MDVAHAEWSGLIRCLRLEQRCHASTGGRHDQANETAHRHCDEALADAPRREDVLPELGLTVTALAIRLGISRRSLQLILQAQRPVTADIAARLSRAIGSTTLFWLNLQTNHDAWHAERAPDLARIRRIKPGLGLKARLAA